MTDSCWSKVTAQVYAPAAFSFAADLDMDFPVVDFSAFGLQQTDVDEEQLDSLSVQLKTALAEIGLVFLKNTGISEDEVDRVMDLSRKFFLQPDELKHPFSRKSFSNNSNHGWVSMETERLNPSRPRDLKEAFNISSFHPQIKWPSEGDLTDFQKIHTSFFRSCEELSLRVLRLMAQSLDLDPDMFLSAHRLIGSDQNGTTLRALHYPPVDRLSTEEGQLRCGEHSDYGTITLLFQGSEGLQVRARSGEFIPAPMIPGAILVNVADLMQRWTSDRFIAVPHRVLLPPAGDCSTRQSLAFFLQPDDAAVISCCDGSNKYPPITSGEYLQERFRETYVRT